MTSLGPTSWSSLSLTLSLPLPPTLCTHLLIMAASSLPLHYFPQISLMKQTEKLSVSLKTMKLQNERLKDEVSEVREGRREKGK